MLTRHPFFIIFSFIFVLFVLYQGALAQDDMIVGSSIEGTLSEPGDTATFQFEAQAGDRFLITVLSEAFDPFVALLDESEIELTSDDDSAGSRNAMISDFVAPEDGTYTIVVSSFQNQESGDFTLTVARITPETIDYDTTVGGQLPPTAPFRAYEFEGTAGDTVIITLDAEGDNPYLQLAPPSGAQLFISDFAGDGTARIGPRLLTENGTYRLNVFTTGEYELSLGRITPSAAAADEAAVGAVDTATGDLYYRYDGRRGQVVNFNVQDVDDVEISLLDSFGNLIASGTGSLDNVAIAEDDTYYVRIAGATDEDVALVITEAELPSLQEGAVTLNFDAEVDQRLLTFTAEEGETVRLSVSISRSSPDINPYVEALQENQTIAFINFGRVSEAEMTFDVPQDGDVSVLVQVYADVDVTVALERVDDGG
jgi:hypothetical protein